MRIQTLISAEAIEARVAELGRELTALYQDEELVVLGVLKGCIIFLSDLCRHLPPHSTEIDLFRVSSYDGCESTGHAKLVADFTVDIRGKHVLLVEDIIDTGVTLQFLREHIMAKAPKSLKVCTLLNKNKVTNQPIDFNGFDIPNQFVIGYGLDHNNKYRNLPYIGVIESFDA